MKAYILKKKGQGSYSHEHHVILADSKKALKMVLTAEHMDIKDFDVEEKYKSGLIYTSIY